MIFLLYIPNPDEAVDDAMLMNFIDLDNVDLSNFVFGKVSTMCGRAAYEYIEKCIQLANAADVDAVTTTAINKEAIKLAGVPYIGHTEMERIKDYVKRGLEVLKKFRVPPCFTR